jgi:hypothetical protein
MKKLHYKISLDSPFRANTLRMFSVLTAHHLSHIFCWYISAFSHILSHSSSFIYIDSLSFPTDSLYIQYINFRPESLCLCQLPHRFFLCMSGFSQILFAYVSFLTDSLLDSHQLFHIFCLYTTFTHIHSACISFLIDLLGILYISFPTNSLFMHQLYFSFSQHASDSVISLFIH